MNSTVLIVDGSNLAHRCRHVFSLSYQELDVSVTYGFIRTLHSVMLCYDPRVVVVCWDGGTPEYRRKHCPTYKQRDRSDDEGYAVFLEQVIELQDMLPLFGVLSVRKVGAEADDLMHHAARLFSGKKVLMTTDQDMYQTVLCDSDTIVYSPTKDLEITLANFQEETNVEPDWLKWMMYRAMVGDSSDGIPGVKGVGPKRALALLQNYDTPTSLVNAANGKGLNVGDTMSISVAQKIALFGIGGFKNAIATARLDRDRVGARQALLQEIKWWQPYAAGEVLEFLKGYAFVSLMEPEVYETFKRLQEPRQFLKNEDLRVPVVAGARNNL